MQIDEQQLNSLYRFACVLCGNRETACDLVHDALEKFLRLKPVVKQSIEAFQQALLFEGQHSGELAAVNHRFERHGITMGERVVGRTNGHQPVLDTPISVDP